MFVDSATITIRSGRGGDGAVSFRRAKYIPKGGPDGGDGGDGGSVVICASQQVATLLDFSGKHHWFAENGQPGQTKQKHGKNGNDIIINLPSGTLVYDDETGELIVDLSQPGKQITLAKGGRGGFGNEHFKSSTNQAPRQYTSGETGEEKNLRLELKLIADMGLVGLPNAGKSTLLSRVSDARPKIADYPFTTLEPQLGIADLAGGRRRLVIADIPGLIEHAHKGQGLGARFLRHIERTRMLVHVIEAQPLDGSNPVNNYRIIRQELAGYGEALASKPEIIALSKMDVLPEDQRREMVDTIEKQLGKKVMPISSASGIGLNELLRTCANALDPNPDEQWK